MIEANISWPSDYSKLRDGGNGEGRGRGTSNAASRGGIGAVSQSLGQEQIVLMHFLLLSFSCLTWTAPLCELVERGSKASLALRQSITRRSTNKRRCDQFTSVVRWGARAVKALLSSNSARGKEGLRVGVNDVRKLLVVIDLSLFSIGNDIQY